MNLSSRKAILRTLSWVMCGLTFAIPPLTWWISNGGPLAYATHNVPPGQSLFVASKLFALMALSLFWLQCMTALSRKTPALRGFFELTRRQHIVLGCVTAGVVLLHVGLFMTASTLRTHHAAWDLLVPTFVQGFYKTNISLGAIAFWLLLLALLAGVLRLRRSAIWPWVHRTIFIVFALGFLHGISIGSETRFGLMTYVYAFIGLSVSTAVGSWAWAVLAARRTLDSHVSQKSSI
jgi:predicted ferric reductase